jgi:uncharacterized protein
MNQDELSDGRKRFVSDTESEAKDVPYDAADDISESRFGKADRAAALSRRHFLAGMAGVVGFALTPDSLLFALERMVKAETFASDVAGSKPIYIHTKSKVPDPKDISFTVQYGDKDAIKLWGHFWYNKDAVKSGKKMPAIVELNPYRRRDGMISGDSRMYPWFAYNEYLCFRVDLQGSGDSEGILADEYTDEELVYCSQVIRQISEHPWCDGNVGMMGESWSAINSLMTAARADCPEALKAVIVSSGSDDRYSDDIHYMGGAMMQDNTAWPSSMWGWLAQPPDPLVVGDQWKELWRERIRNADFWFSRWGAHQKRDAYWDNNSVRYRFDEVKVPVYIISGWQDGYKNPVDRTVRGVAAAGMPTAGIIGPWGHGYPYNCYPGPMINWLPYAVTHWWDKWLKGKEPSPDSELPQLTVWLGKSREPKKSPGYDDKGRWVAEDYQWPERTLEKIYYPAPKKRLSEAPPSRHARIPGSNDLLFVTAMLETSSYGDSGNPDLPGNLAAADKGSLYFDTPVLTEDFDCFGYPTATLNLTCDKSLACLAVRLCEVSPHAEAVHLVTYSFFNLCYRDGDMADPKPIEPGVPFRVCIPMNITGHTFRKGWKIRLSVSPSFFPTLWQSPEAARITLHTGGFAGFPASKLMLPGRNPRAEDALMSRLLPRDASILSVYVDDYVPTTTDPDRPGSNSRSVRPVTVDHRKGLLVNKLNDYGRCCYDGHLSGLWVDQVSTENFRMLYDEPGSLTCFTTCRTVLERPSENWKVRAVTSTKVWTESGEDGLYRFRYRAGIKTYIWQNHGGFTLFEKRKIEGTIPRSWV